MSLLERLEAVQVIVSSPCDKEEAHCAYEELDYIIAEMSKLQLDPYIRRARLGKVTDGDTVRMVVDLGYRNFTETAIRLVDVNAPEIFRGTAEEKKKGQESKAFVWTWFSQHDRYAIDIDWPYLIKSQKDKKSFDRWLGTIYAGNGDILNEDIVKHGFGVKR